MNHGHEITEHVYSIVNLINEEKKLVTPCDKTVTLHKINIYIYILIYTLNM